MNEARERRWEKILITFPEIFDGKTERDVELLRTMHEIGWHAGGTDEVQRQIDKAREEVKV